MAESTAASGQRKETETPKTPHDLVKKHDVESALRADEGPLALLNSFTIKDFTTKGDNYACAVPSVELEYTKDGKTLSTSYVVKLNPCRETKMNSLTMFAFEKEIGFYAHVLPLLNKALESVKEKNLRTPQYLHSVGRNPEQAIYFKDLRKLGYKMCDRQKGMDKAHTELILSELARLHAASNLLMSSDEFRGVDLVQRFPFLRDFFNILQDEDSPLPLNDLMNRTLENTAKIAERNEGYEYVAQYLRTKKDDIIEDFTKLLGGKKPFKVICHGDCWNNNFLFRYGRDGKPVECCLLDLQVVRVGSPVLDLNYMLYCSLDGDVRSSNLSSFFASYYASFASVLAAARQPMHFTLTEFTKEFYDKNFFGLLMGMMLIPIVLMDSEDTPSLDDFERDDVQQAMDEWQEKIMEIVQKSKLLTPRFLSMFNEMKESGLFNTASVSKLVQNYNSFSL